jgi:mycothiol synthase
VPEQNPSSLETASAPCLYLLWPCLSLDASEVAIPTGYRLRTYGDGDERSVLQLLQSDSESISTHEWHRYRDMILPDGLFLVQCTSSGEFVATAGSVHNPNPGRYYFPFGGELGYLIVAPQHRRRGLGVAVCSAVIRRFRSAGYTSVRVCVQEHRQAAIRLYLRLGFEPFLHSTDVERRWQRVCAAVGVPFAPQHWPRAL